MASHGSLRIERKNAIETCSLATPVVLLANKQDLQCQFNQFSTLFEQFSNVPSAARNIVEQHDAAGYAGVTRRHN